jgi:hypothetical protein
LFRHTNSQLNTLCREPNKKKHHKD